MSEKNIAKQEYIARIADNVFGKNCIIYVLVKKLKITATIVIYEFLDKKIFVYKFRTSLGIFIFQ